MGALIKTKLRVFDIIEKSSSAKKASGAFDYFIVTLILLNVIAIVLESFQNLASAYGIYFRLFEVFSVVVFTIEYVSRIWIANLKYESRIRFIASPLAIIDLLAILPFYLPMIIPFDLRFLRMLRLTRLLRILKLNRYSRSLNLLGKVFQAKKDELTVTVLLALLLIMIASTMMFYIENEIQPDKFPNIISTFWWAIATLTTVGYGDVYPITGWGRFLSGIIAVLGIGLVALPTGILSSGFMDELKTSREAEDYEETSICPHCGNEIIRKRKAIV